MEIAEIATLWVIVGGIFSLVFMVGFNAYQVRLDRKIKTLEYVTGQFDRLAQLGARAEMSKMGDQNILEYIGDDKEKKQKMLEYVYTSNRIGLGISKGALKEDIVFNIWTPRWFEGLWQKFEPLITQERKRRGEQAKGAYVFFDWLAKEKCPEIREKYPQKPAAT